MTGWDSETVSRRAAMTPISRSRTARAWTVTGVGEDGSLVLRGHGRRDREVPSDYATRFVELAYATTVHGAQGETVASAHVVIGEHTGAAAAYVAMTRGRASNTAHVVAESVEDARQQWIEVFSRDRADLGPAHARRQSVEAIEVYGAQARRLTPQRRPSSSADRVPFGL